MSGISNPAAAPVRGGRAAPRHEGELRRAHHGAAPCPTCGREPRHPARGGPVRIGVVLDEVVHDLGRCPEELRAKAAGQGGGR
jgi:hypothetical protein